MDERTTRYIGELEHELLELGEALLGAGSGGLVALRARLSVRNARRGIRR